MRLVWLKLRGFRRFREADVQLDGKLVALVGPNEAGKSSVLHALRGLEEEGLLATDITHELELEPSEIVIRARFLLEAGDKEAISHLPGADHARWFTYAKRADGKIVTGVEPRIGLDLTRRSRAATRVRNMLTTKWSNSFENDEEDEASPRLRLEAVLPHLEAVGVLTEEGRNAIQELLDAIQPHLPTGPKSLVGLAAGLTSLLADEPETDPNDEARRILRGRRPQFRLFGPEERDLQSDYELSTMDIEEPPRGLANLARLAHLDLSYLLERIKAGDYAAAERPIETANEELERFFKSSWKQAGVAVRLSLHETRLHLFITTPTGPYTSLRERSDGLRAFVALTTFASFLDNSRDLVLLIDEAETHLTLHYDAQADLIRVLSIQEAARKIVYTTHSAGCLPENLGSAVRVVSRVDDITSVVHNSFWRHGSGFSPLLLGMGASALVFAAVRQAVVTEGAADLILLPSLLQEALGAETLGYQVTPGIAEISQGAVDELELQAARVVYVVDGDDGGRGHAKKLQRAGVDLQRILKLGEDIESGLVPEDLVRREIYLQAVNMELDRSGRQERMRLSDIPNKGRTRAVARWCSKNGFGEPKRIAVASRLVIDLRPEHQLLSGAGRKVLIDLNRKIRAALKERPSLSPRPVAPRSSGSTK